MNILITGSSKGLGAALAREFATKSINNLYLTSRDSKLLDSLSRGIEKDFPGVNVYSFSYDLINYEEIRELSGKIKALSGKLDVLINNAGALIKGDFTQITKEQIEYIFSVNYFAPALLTREFIPMLKMSDNAHVMNISSMSGYQGSVKFPGLSHYGASKAALSALTESLAVEFEKEKISFNAIAMGSVQTEMLEEAFPGIEAPLTPAEMAVYLADFAITGHKYMNGKILPVSLSTP